MERAGEFAGDKLTGFLIAWRPIGISREYNAGVGRWEVSPKTRGCHGYALQTSERNSQGATQRQRLQGVPGTGRHLGSPEAVPDLRARGLLRRLQKQTCHQTFSLHKTPHHPIVRARRRLEVVLRG